MYLKIQNKKKNINININIINIWLLKLLKKNNNKLYIHFYNIIDISMLLVLPKETLMKFLK